MAYARSIIDGFGNRDRRLYHEVTDDELLGPRLRVFSEDRETGEDLQVEHEALHLTAEDAETIAAGYALLANILRDREAARAKARGEDVAEDSHGVQEPVATGGE